MEERIDARFKEQEERFDAKFAQQAIDIAEQFHFAFESAERFFSYFQLSISYL